MTPRAITGGAEFVPEPAEILGATLLSHCPLRLDIVSSRPAGNGLKHLLFLRGASVAV